SNPHADINTLLTLCFICSPFLLNEMHDLFSVTRTENSVWSSPVKTPKDFQKISNNSKYLYRQLHHVEKELGLLGPSRFPNPNNYNRAMQQVQGLKSHLEVKTIIQSNFQLDKWEREIVSNDPLLSMQDSVC
uniref:Uncharacterized protein n=1 Tax=Oryzias latipes TaxID=8090 RepID=A0A3B3HEN7_ORYLA